MVSIVGETKQTSWQENKTWADKYSVHVAQILGPYFIKVGSLKEDQEENTDFKVLRGEYFRIACRIRKLRDREKYGHEFTIRSRLASGAKTEIDKILEGWGTHIFYGFGDDRTGEIPQWFLGDLEIFRSWLRGEYGGVPTLRHIRNVDGRSWLSPFRINDLPKEFIIASCGIGERS